jgi:glycosyltransferase involved in cell wall biosynthesis
MHVLLITNISYPNGMADTRRVRSLIQGFDANKISVDLIVSVVNSEINIDNFNCKIECASTISKSDFKKKSLLGLVQNRFKWFKNCIKLLTQNKYDLIYFYQPNIDNFLVAIIVKFFYHRKTCVEYCDIVTKDNNNNSIYILQKIAWRYFPLFVDNIIVISTRLKRYFNIYHSTLNVFLMPAFYTRRNDNLLTTKNYKSRIINIIFTGSFIKSEGLDMLFRVFSQIIFSHDNVLLHIAGYSLLSTKDDPFLLSKKYNVEKYVRLHGYLDSDKVFELQDMGHILVLTKLNTKVNRFGFSTKLLDYLSSNKLVVCSDISDFKLYLEDKYHLFYFNSDNDKSLHETLVYCIENFKNLSMVSSRGFQRASEIFDPAIYIKKLKEMLEK